jgi:hypothetical protein
MKKAIDCSLGRRAMVTTHIEDGEEITKTCKSVNLNAFARFSEQMGKRLGLFTQKKIVNTEEDGELSRLMKQIAANAKKSGPIRH